MRARLTQAKLYILMLTASAFALSGYLYADAFVVEKGKPQALNAKAGTAEAKKIENKVIIKDPIFRAPQKVVKRAKPKKAKARKRKESVQSFKGIAIDGRRSIPRVDFALPVIDVQRVDENYSFEAREKILESE